MKKNGFLIRFISVMLCITMILSMDVQTVSAMIAACEGTDIAVCEVQEGDALYEQYLSTLFYGKPTKNRLRSLSYFSSTLNEHERMLYLALKEQIEKVAAGEITNTEFTIEDADYLRFTPEELGLESISKDNRDDWVAAIEEQIDYAKIWHNLLADCPYDLYWHDKTKGISLNDYVYKYYSTGTGVRIKTFTIRFEVDTKYAATGDDGDPLPYQTNLRDSENLQRAVAAADNAEKIVEENKNETDYNKLYNYMTKICELNTYNDDAAAEKPEVMEQEGMAPWQLIYVFDGDPNTNVVCEGYAKAFSYLCDLTAFDSLDIECYIVNGPMDGGTGGGGGHMWNVVTMDDKKNYLVDVTNCDDDSVGAPDLLFLAALPGSADTLYTFTTEDGDETTFAYYPAMQKLYGTGEDSILTLAETKTCTVYQPKDDPAVSVTIGDDTTDYANIRQAMDAADGETATIKLLQDVSTTGVELDGDITIDLNGHTWTNWEGDMDFEKLTITDSSSAQLEKEGSLIMPSDQSDPMLNVLTEYTQDGGIVLAQVLLLEGCKAYISDGYLEGLFVMDGTDVLLTGGAFEEIMTAETQTLGDLLGVDYAYATFENWTTESTGWMLGDEVLNGTAATYVVVREAPIQSVNVSGDTEIGESGSTTLTAKAKLPEEITGDVSYQWESVSEDGTTISKVGTGQTLALSNQQKGSHQYRLTATLGNYAVTKYVTVSVGLKTCSISLQEGKYQTTYTYGQTVTTPTEDKYTVKGSDEANKPNVSFAWYQGDFTTASAALPENKKLAEDKKPTAVGSYTLVATASGGNYAPAECRTLVTIEKADLSDQQLTKLVTVPTGKTYDRAACKAVLNNTNKISGAGTATIFYAAAGSTAYTKTAPIAAGSYDVFVDVAEGTCYKLVTKKKIGSFTIDKADPTIVLGNLTQTQGKVSAVTAEIAPESTDAKATVEYNVKDAVSGVDHWTTEQPTEVGSYEVRAWLAFANAGNNLVGYADYATAQAAGKAVTGTLTIKKKPDAADSAASEETPPRKPEGSSGGPATDTGSTSGDPAPEKKEESTADKSPAATQTVEVDTDEAAAVVVTIKTSADGEKTAKAAVTKEISGTKTVISANLADQITKAAGTDDVTVTMTVKNEAGKTLYKVRVNTSDLEAGNKLYIYQKKSDGSYVMVNAKKYTVNKSGAVAVSMDKKATYELVNAAEADTINRQILAAVKPAAKSRTLSVGKTFRFALAKGLDPANVKTITYKTSDASTATVSKNGTVRTKSKGTVVIKAIVTLKNGTTKTVKMKVKGK